MYKAYLNDNLFFSQESTENSLKLITGTIQQAAGKAGSFSFSLSSENEAFGKFKLWKSYVDVYRDGGEDPIFSGRVRDDGQEFLPVQSIVCEGMLAVLNDTVFRPIEYTGTLEGLVKLMIDSHNEQVDDTKQLTLRKVEVEDDYMYRKYENIAVTFSRLDDLVKSYGGYLEVTKESGVLFLDWRESESGICDQTIDFGKNLLDITQEASADEIITRVIPLGAEIETETEDGGRERKRIDITSVNANLDYVENAQGVAEYGAITEIVTWDDVTTPAALKTKAQEYVNNKARGKVSINLSAVDLADAGEDMERFKVRQSIRVRSELHGIDDRFLCVEQTLDLLHPDQGRLVLSDSRTGYICRMASENRKTEQTVERIRKNYALNERINEIEARLNERFSEINQKADALELLVGEIQRTASGTETRLNGITNTLDGIELFVNQNGRKLGYLYLEAETGTLWIGKDEDPIKLAETNNAIMFVDSANNNVLLMINTEGIISPTVSAQRQLSLLSGDYQEWAIRLGEADSDGNHNLDILYVGNQ